MTHELKIWFEYFEVVITNKKKFEIRKNDRNFKVGDYLRLMEWDTITSEYTGRSTIRKITYILKGDNPFINLGNNVIMSIK